MMRISSVLSWGIGPCRETNIALISLSLRPEIRDGKRQCSRKRPLVKTELGQLSRTFVPRIPRSRSFLFLSREPFCISAWIRPGN
jgi:hypothetical protein